MSFILGHEQQVGFESRYIKVNLWQGMEKCIGSEVLTVVVLTNSMFWDIKSCSPSEVNFQQISQHYIPEDRNHQLKNMFLFVFNNIKSFTISIM
jgi:hypothetical protein